jgi:ABC-type sulfate transport system substrate-binding protein
VWKTEVLKALREDAPVEGIELNPEDSLRQEVSYAIGAVTTGRHAAHASAYLSFLRSPEAQQTYANFGFVPATSDELALRPIP